MNSQDDPSANGRSISSTRWNGHYLVPKGDTATDNSSPIPAFTGATPDWVFVTDAGATVITSPSNAVIGRYSYAVYAEGGLLDMNVAGYPTRRRELPPATIQPGRKGSVAYADLTALGSTDPNSEFLIRTQLEFIKWIGWWLAQLRDYSANQQFPRYRLAPSFRQRISRPTAATRPATVFYNYVLNNTNGFLSPTATATWNRRTDQVFMQRQQLIAFRKTIGRHSFPQMLSSISAHSRGKPMRLRFRRPLLPGSSIDYAALANSCRPLLTRTS